MTANESHRGSVRAHAGPDTAATLLQTFGRNRTAGDKGADVHAPHARAPQNENQKAFHDARGAPGCVTVRPRGASQSGPGVRHSQAPGRVTVRPRGASQSGGRDGRPICVCLLILLLVFSCASLCHSFVFQRSAYNALLATHSVAGAHRSRDLLILLEHALQSCASGEPLAFGVNDLAEDSQPFLVRVCLQ